MFANNSQTIRPIGEVRRGLFVFATVTRDILTVCQNFVLDLKSNPIQQTPFTYQLCSFHRIDERRQADIYTFVQHVEESFKIYVLDQYKILNWLNPLRLSGCPSVGLSTCLVVRLSGCPSVQLPICPFIHLFSCPYLQLAVCPCVQCR